MEQVPTKRGRAKLVCPLQTMGVSPCVVIDDKERNVEAASNFGMHGIQFESAQQLKSELKKLGVRE